MSQVQTFFGKAVVFCFKHILGKVRVEQKQKQKREGGKLIQASDLKSASSVKRGARPLSGRRELHGYEGPLQFLHGNNPDEMTTVQVDIHPFLFLSLPV